MKNTVSERVSSNGAMACRLRSRVSMSQGVREVSEGCMAGVVCYCGSYGAVSVENVLSITPPSRAGSHPHGSCGACNIQKSASNPCGSELASESGGSACINTRCADVFASKLAPTEESEWVQVGGA